MSNVKYKSAVAAGIVAGSAVGLVTGLLMAPKSGKQLREDIASKTGDAADTAAEKINDAKDATKDKTIKAREKIADKVS